MDNEKYLFLIIKDNRWLYMSIYLVNKQAKLNEGDPSKLKVPVNPPGPFLQHLNLG